MTHIYNNLLQWSIRGMLSAVVLLSLFSLTSTTTQAQDPVWTVNAPESDWFQNYSDDPRVMAGGEHAWDLQSTANQILTTGLYLYSVKDIASGEVQTGKIVIIK